MDNEEDYQYLLLYVDQDSYSSWMQGTQLIHQLVVLQVEHYGALRRARYQAPS